MAEKAERAEVWSRLLFRIIPENRLQECFDRAFAGHDSAFPITAYDLKNAWDTWVDENRPEHSKLLARVRMAAAYLKDWRGSLSAEDLGREYSNEELTERSMKLDAAKTALTDFEAEWRINGNGI